MRIQVSGLPAVGSHTYQLEVVDHYGECCSVGPAQTIITVGPKPLAAINSLQVEAIKAATGKKAKKETVLVLQFSGALNAAAADNAGAYELRRSSRSGLRAKVRTASRQQSSWARPWRWPRPFTTARTSRSRLLPGPSSRHQSPKS